MSKSLFIQSAADSTDDALTSREHHNDCENHFIVSDGGDVAKADGAEPGKDKVQGGAVAALQGMERGQTRSTLNIEPEYRGRLDGGHQVVLI